jgi:hypothetical protein
MPKENSRFIQAISTFQLATRLLYVILETRRGKKLKHKVDMIKLRFS